MSPTAHASTDLRATESPHAAVLVAGARAGRRDPLAVLVLSLLGVAAFLVDALSGESHFALLGLVGVAMALAVVLRQAQLARIGLPWRTARRAAWTAMVASTFVAASLSAVGLLEQMGPRVTGSAALGAGVAVMSLVLLVVLPLALVVFGWGVMRDRRLAWWMRGLPWTLVLVLACAASTQAVLGGRQELWLQAVAITVAGAVLTSFSVGLWTGVRRLPVPPVPLAPRRAGVGTRQLRG